MSRTQHQTERILPTIDRQTPSSLRKSLDIVTSFSDEPLFIDKLHENGIDPHDPTSLDYANALSYYAEDYCTTYADTLDDQSKQEISLIANTPYMLHISHELAHYEKERKSRYLSDEEYSYMNQTLKTYAVWYNQKLSDYMYAYNDAKFSAITETLSDAAYESFPRAESAVSQQVEIIARGARTEAVGRQLLEDTPVEYMPGSAEDDLRGGDIIIMYKGKRIKVDFKSSLDAIARLRGGYDELMEKGVSYALTHNKHDKYGAIVLFPGFTDKELGDECHLPPAIAEKKSLLMSIQLQRALNELGL